MSTLIMGNSIATVEQMRTYIKSKNSSIAESVLDMIPLYISEGNTEGVRGDIAFAQSCLETGNFTFKGSAVTLDQNNFAGMGVTSNGVKGNSWDTPQLGIRAQIQHLKAYASDEDLVNECVDTRFKYVVRKCAECVEYLGMKENPTGNGWSSGKGYGESILTILNSILSIKVVESSNTKSYAEKAVEWAVNIANDDTHGYDQAKREGPDYDCSSLIINAYEQAGLPLKSKGASYTGNIEEVALNLGFTNVTTLTNQGKNIDKLESGDILLNPSSHVEMYIGNNQKVGAHINEKGTTTGGKTGDQTGHEIDVSKMSGTWKVVLRPPKSTTNNNNETENNDDNANGGTIMKFNVHGGHNFIVPGAGGCFSETSEDRKVKDLVISKLRSLGHTVYDCTDDAGRTAKQNLANIVAKCNAHSVDLDISIHFNAFNGTAHGTEVWQYSNKTSTYATNIVNSLAALGFTKRGVKKSTGLYVLRNTKSKAILIECCFCDNGEDAKIYTAEKVATAIVKGITGKTVGIKTPANNNGNSTNANGRACPFTVKITADVLNVRKGPGTNYAKTTQVKRNYRYTIVATQGNWGKLKSGAGWICLDFCKYV